MGMPTLQPSMEPTAEPTIDPTQTPTTEPSIEPSFMPSDTPTSQPSIEPTKQPTIQPSTEPTTEPTADPITDPTMMPTADPITSTIDTTSAPTTEPTLEPTAMPTIVPQETIVSVEISVSLSSGNATEEEIRAIILTLIDEIDDNLEIDSYEVTETANGYVWTFEIIAQSEESALLLVASIGDDEFKQDLIEEIEANTNSEVSDVELNASIVDKDDDKDDDDDLDWLDIDRWLDWESYSLLQWIIVGALLCILCVCCLFLCRCCFLCNKSKKKKNKNGYQVGNAMFGSVRPSSMDADDAFQSDLRSAIEMNNIGKLLKAQSGPSLADVNVDGDGKKESDAKTKLLDKKEAKKDGDKGTGVTPGGPDDDDDNPPPAPEPPKDVQSMDEYDLL